MFPLTSSNIAQTLGHGPSAGLGRRATASAVIVGAAAIALLAFAHTSANAAENSTRAAQEQHACAVLMGLDPSGRSLDRSWAEWDQARLVQTGRSACSQKGSSPARQLSQCAC
jgi:hypothetical protein